MIEKREAVKYLPEKQEDNDTTYQQTPQIEEGGDGGNTTAASPPPNSNTSAEEEPEHTYKQDEPHHDNETTNGDGPRHNETPNHEPTTPNKPHDPEEESLPSENTPLLTRTLTSTSLATKSYFSRHFPKLSILARSPRLIAAIYGCLTHTMLLACIDSILPLFVKRTFDWTATGAGTIFLTISCPSLFGTVFGALADRFGSRVVSLSGMALTTLNLGLIGLCAENELRDKVLLCVFLVLAGEFPHTPPPPASCCSFVCFCCVSAAMTFFFFCDVLAFFLCVFFVVLPLAAYFIFAESENLSTTLLLNLFCSLHSQASDSTSSSPLSPPTSSPPLTRWPPLTPRYLARPERMLRRTRS